MSGRQQRVMVQPINLIFKNLQQAQGFLFSGTLSRTDLYGTQQTKISVWLYDNVEMRIEGRISGFDEFMNLVIDDAEEVYVKDAKPRVSLGRILLKGDNITLIQQLV